MNKRDHLFRYIMLGAIYVIACLIFVGRLIDLQIAGQDYYTQSSSRTTYTRTVPIQAIRGQIYDANGVSLVSNVFTYDINLDAAGLPASNYDKNEHLWSILRRYADFGGNWEMPECAFTVQYHGAEPMFIWNKAYLLNEDGSLSVYGKRLWKIIDELTEDDDDDKVPEGMLHDAQRAGMIMYKRYGLSYVEKKETLYTYADASKAMAIFALRLDMELKNFGVGNPYVIFPDASLDLITYMTEGSSRGLWVKTNYERHYDVPGYASHILGRVGKITAETKDYYTEKGYRLDAIVGISGAEKAFEEYLRGVDGELTIVEDSEGNAVDEYVSVEPRAGCDVYLTIDIEFQKFAEDTFDANIAYIRATAEPKEDDPDGSDAAAGALSVLNAKTGAVLALVSNPTYDLSTFNEDYKALAANEHSPLFNRALNGTYAPGSTFKVGVAAAALTEGILSPYTELPCDGFYHYYEDTGFKPRCWLETMYHAGGHGSLNITRAIQVSCNCFFYETGRLLGIGNINKYCRAYGLGQETGIELDESLGVLSGPEYRAENGLGAWSPGDTVQTAIGQLDSLFTPLQMSCYISTVVNGGDRYAAHILKEVRTHAEKELVYAEKIGEIAQIDLDEEAVSVVLNAMRNVVEETTGSASRLFGEYPIAIGGKTGTAQVSSKKSPNAVFTAFAPFDDPQIIGTAVIEQGNGGTDAGYAVRDVFTKYFDLKYADGYDVFRDEYLAQREKPYAAAMEDVPPEA